MKLRLKQTATQKLKLSSTLRSWLPLLQANLESLEDAIEPFVKENPFIEVKSAREKNEAQFAKKSFFEQIAKNSVSQSIEALSIAKKSLYEVLNEQINPPLFPTKISQNIAYEIIEHINYNGYFEFDEQILQKLNITLEELEKIRQRFAYLEPPGVGAVDYKESFLFQLDDLDIEPDLYSKVKELVLNFENLDKFAKSENYEEALRIIKKFHIPPAIEYLEEQIDVIPDIFVYENDGKIEVLINDSYYPEIVLDTEGNDETHEYISQKIKDAKDLIDALEMRKATLYKIGLMIVEYQYEFFLGGQIKAMRLKDIAEDLDRNPSTVSRAISNKYLSCNRGIIPLKQFFAAAIDEETSNASIKEYIKDLVKYENQNKPLSDIKILQMVENQFGVKIVRRTITKYRKQLNIASSSERKKLYLLQS